jgi:hypothetical protein
VLEVSRSGFYAFEQRSPASGPVKTDGYRS